MNKHRINIPMCLASIFLCLTLFSFHLMGGLFAKYSVSASASDSARVITFGDVFITETGDFNEANGRKVAIVPGVDLNKDVKVTFEGSEAATFVFLEVVTEGWNTADNFKFTADGTFEADNEITWSIVPNTADGNDLNDWIYLTSSINTETGATTHVYYIAVEPNTELNDVPVIANGIITVPSGITRAEYGTLGGMKMTFSAVAVQASNFESAEAAWNSVAG